MISQLYREFPQLKSITWNYLEAGHGKGAPDGVGAVLKRTADQVVRFGSDVESLNTFLACLRPRVKIEIRVVSKNDIAARCFPKTVKTAKKTMMVHQVLWSFGNSKLSLRKLSCFRCNNEVICSHSKHIGYYDIPSCEGVNTDQFKSFLDENTTSELIQEITDTSFAFTSSEPLVSSENHSSKRPDSPIVKILSNINVTDWDNRKFYINKQNLAKMKANNNKTYHTDFEKFIMMYKDENGDDAKENKDEELDEKKTVAVIWTRVMVI